MKNKTVKPTPPKKKSAKALAAKAVEMQAARLAANITAREAEAAKKRANDAKLKFKSAKKAWKQTRKAAKRAAKRAKEAREILTALTKKLKPSKKKAAAKPSVKKKAASPKRKPAVLPTSAPKPAALVAPAVPGDAASA